MYKILEAYKEGLASYFVDTYPIMLDFYIDTQLRLHIIYRKEGIIVFNVDELFSDPLPSIIFKIEKAFIEKGIIRRVDN